MHASAGDGAVVDALVKDGLWDPHADIHMGSCAELCAERYAITRQQQVCASACACVVRVRVRARGTCMGLMAPTRPVMSCVMCVPTCA